MKLCLVTWLLPVAGLAQSLPQNIQPAPIFYFSQNFPEPLPDSALMILFLKSISVPHRIKKEVYHFYKDRSFSFAWVANKGFSIGALNFYNKGKSYSRNFADKTLNNASLDMLF